MVPPVNVSPSAAFALSETPSSSFQPHSAEIRPIGLSSHGMASAGRRYVTAWKWLLAGVVLFLLFFFRLGSYPFFDPDEPRYAETARQMTEAGHWITPFFNGQIRLDKPVLFYWLIAGIYKLLGISEFSARLVSASAATFTVGIVFAFARHWLTKRAAWFSAFILSTSVLFIGVARMSITDMTLTAWMTATTLCLFMSLYAHSRWWLAVGLFAGLGLLTKGPVALAVPLAVFGIHWLATGLERRAWRTPWMPLGLLLSFAIAVPWYLLAAHETGPIFWDALFKHNMTRYASVVSGHQQPVWYYVVVLLAGFLPWTAYLPSAVLLLWQRIRANHRERVAQCDFAYLVSLYGAIWTVFVFGFFSAAQTRLPTYILPLFPALALFLGEAWALCQQSLVPAPVSMSPDSAEPVIEQALSCQTLSKAMDTQHALRWLQWASVVLTALLTVAGLVFILRMDVLLPREAEGIRDNGFNGLGMAFMVLGTLVASRFLMKRRLSAALFAQAGAVMLTLIVALYGILPAISYTAQGKMLHYLALSGQHPLMLYDLQRPSLTFYGRRTIPRFGGGDFIALSTLLHQHTQAFVITRNSRVSGLQNRLKSDFAIRVIDHDSRYSLLGLRARVPQTRSKPTGVTL
jgi:4-amino-4-deoxy-L-arabinose transferase-like glycosyltransferase